MDSIKLGDDFAEVIANAVGSCDVLLALIGDRWLTITDEDGRRRLDDPDDFVRLEIETALERDIRVIPVLFEGARLPRARDLPVSLSRLVRRQALELSPSRFDADIGKLLRVLDTTLADEQVRREEAAKAAREAEEQARREAEAQAAREAEEQTLREAEERKLSAVETMANHLRSGDPPAVASAEGALRRLANDANQRVAQTAGSVLTNWEAEKQAQREAEDQQARHKGEQAARQAEEQARREAEAKAQREAEAAAAAQEAKAKAKQEAEAQSRAKAEEPAFPQAGKQARPVVEAGKKPVAWWRSRKGLAVTSAFLVIIVIVVTVQLRTKSPTVTDRSAPPSTGSSVAATIRVSGKPLAVAVGSGAVWVANTGSKTIARIDPSTNRVAATIKMRDGPSGIAVGAGAVWVTHFASSTVTRIDPSSNRVVKTIEVGGGPTAVAVGAGSVWIVLSGYNWVSRIDPASNRETFYSETAASSGIAVTELRGSW